MVEATADRLWIVRGGTVKSYDGDMDSYRAELLAERGAKAKEKARERDAPGANETRADQRRAAAVRQNHVAGTKPHHSRRRARGLHNDFIARARGQSQRAVRGNLELIGRAVPQGESPGGAKLQQQLPRGI